MGISSCALTSLLSYHRIMKLYTRIGDDGSTRLFGNQQVRKDDPRVEAYGSVDELNAILGLALVGCAHEEITRILRFVQNRLFDVGADLATPAVQASGESAGGGSGWQVYRISGEDAGDLEKCIDQMWEPLPPMKNFILPGGTELAARLHVARTVCRRAERLCVTLARDVHGIGEIIIYLNRLSDLLFAMSRRANQLEGVVDVPWKKKE